MDFEGADSDLVDLAVCRDTRAFGSLVVRHQACIRGYIARFVSDTEEVSDLAQDVFIAAYRSLGGFQRGGDFRKWLYGIAGNVVRSYLRQKSIHRNKDLERFEESLRRWKTEKLERTGAGQDLLSRLRECVDKLDAARRDLVERRYFEGLDLRTLAGRLGKGAGTLAVELMRARAILARCVKLRTESTQ
jgi:RNA polymerase sigma-70 factor (ECF subfamily)